jgi:hypothetical protein
MTTANQLLAAAGLALAIGAAPAQAVSLTPMRGYSINGVMNTTIVSPRNLAQTYAVSNSDPSQNQNTPFGEVFSLTLNGTKSQVSSYNSVIQQNGIMKAVISSKIYKESNIFVPNDTARTVSDIFGSNSDVITFTGIAPGKRALVAVSSFAHEKLGYQTVAGYPQLSSYLRNSAFSFSTKATLYQNAFDANWDLAPKDTAIWKVCDNIILCPGTDFLINGAKSNTDFFFVDSDDVLVVENSLHLGNSLIVNFPNAFSFSDFRLLTQKNDFGNSGYTLINVLNPGVSYVSAAGAQYLTSAPPGIPEPASWAMLIAGFGLTGAAMRQRRRGIRAVA